MPISCLLTIRGLNVVVTTTMVPMRVHSTSTGTMAVRTITTRFTWFLWRDYNILNLIYIQLIVFKDTMVMFIVEVLFLFNNS